MMGSMSDAKDVFAAALGLGAKERAELVEQLLLSLDDEPEDDPAEVAASWDAEIKRRVEDLESGRLKTVPWSEVRERLDEIVNDKKPRGR
jgi:putative addiction module component (TIGR02574 family)